MRKFVKFFNIPPDKISKEHIYDYQAYLVNDKKAEIADKRAKEKLEFIDDALKVYEETILSGTTLPHLGEMLSAQYDGICGLDISSHFTLQGYR